jgi:hypothetical protein
MNIRMAKNTKMRMVGLKPNHHSVPHHLKHLASILRDIKELRYVIQLKLYPEKYTFQFSEKIK